MSARVGTGTEFHIQIQFPAILRDTDHITRNERQLPSDTGGYVDPAGGMERYVVFARVG